jgi:capsular polysaccharide transport system ATP-binding protein
MIIAEDVHKRYLTDHGPGQWVLQGVSFTIPPRVSVGLVGRNGAGKSTLLRLIGGTDIPTRGKVERNCRVSWPMGFGGGLQGSLTGRQNAKFVCRIHGHEEDVLDRVAYIEDFADLGTYFDEPVKTYSSGMRSRMNFALSMAFDFDVYISDEVTAAGDIAFKDKAAAAFKKLSDHASIIMVSHGEGTLKRFCTAGIWLHEGKAHWFDKIDDALQAYKSSLHEHKPQGIKQNERPPAVIQKAPTIVRLNKFKQSFSTLEAGLKGEAGICSEAESKRVIKHAKKIGIELLPLAQLVEQGYILKQGAVPVLRTRPSSPDQQPMDFYEVDSQCMETGNNK